MHVLDRKLDLERFFASLVSAQNRVLFVDYDGTLAPFHTDPGRAVPYPRACEVLHEIVAAPRSRVVIVSGRRFEDLEPCLGLVPHTEAWASHGWESLLDGQVLRRMPPAAAKETLRLARARCERYTEMGARIETKIASVAVHWRGLPEATAARIRRSLGLAWRPLAHEDLALLPFDGGLEILARGRDKGEAVRETLSRYAGHAAAYLGDDLTDEAAFRAIRGEGLAVLVRKERRRTQAQVWLSPPAALTRFLQQWRDSLA